MYAPVDFRPTPSRVAFVPDTIQYMPDHERHFYYKVLGYWWSGNPRRRILHYGAFLFGFEAIDDRLHNYHNVDFDQVLKIANNHGYFTGQRYLYHYQTFKEEYARYDGAHLTIALDRQNIRTDTTALVAFYDSLTTPTPLHVPAGAVGWYQSMIWQAGYNEVEHATLSNRKTFYYPAGYIT